MAVLALALLLCTDADASPHRNDKVYQAAVGNRSGVLDLLREIVDIDSGTGDVAGGTKVEAILADHLKAIGAGVRNEAAVVPRLYLFTRVLMETGAKPPCVACNQ